MGYEIRAMSLGEVLDTGFRLVRDHFAILVGIGLTISLPASLINVLAGRVAHDPTAINLAAIFASGLFVLVVSPIVSAAITQAVSELYLDRKVTYGDAIRFGFKLLLPLVGTALLMTLIVIAGFVLLIIPGIYLMLAFLLTYQVMVIEHRAGWNALKRTRELSSGNLLRIFAVYLVAMLLMAVVDGGLSLATVRIPMLGWVVSAIVQAVFTAYLAAAMVVLYFDIRCRKEAFDLEHLAGLVRGGGVASPLDR
jgi:hypothetical protein